MRHVEMSQYATRLLTTDENASGTDEGSHVSMRSFSTGGRVGVR
jgi:hypothetical protein